MAGEAVSFRIPPGSIDLDSQWDANDLVIIDTETTGKDVDSRIVEIAMIHVGLQGVQEEWSSLVKPGVTIPKGASKIHGITDKMVKDKPKFTDLYDEIIDRIRGRIPVAFNLTYDWQVLRSEAKRIDKPWFVFFGICPLTLARGLIKGVPGGYKQVNLTRHLGIHDEKATDHRALDDTKHTAQVLEVLAESMDGWTIQELWDFQVETARRFEKRMAIRKNGKAVVQEWHTFTAEET